MCGFPVQAIQDLQSSWGKSNIKALSKVVGFSGHSVFFPHAKLTGTTLEYLRLTAAVCLPHKKMKLNKHSPILVYYTVNRVGVDHLSV